MNMQPRTMQKRRIPMFGFIGDILGPVVGVMTAEDGEDYTNSINELYDCENNLSRVLRQYSGSCSQSRN